MVMITLLLFVGCEGGFAFLFFLPWTNLGRTGVGILGRLAAPSF